MLNKIIITIINNQSLFYLVVLCFIFLSIEFIISPIGNFPLNDDWSYSKTAIYFSIKGIFNPYSLPAMSLFSHTVWGSVFVNLFGASHTVLRFSTLVMAFIGLVFFYLLIQQSQLIKPNHAFLVTVLVIVNPLYINLSNSYMTDVPFITSILAALYFYLKFSTTKKTIFFILSLVCLVWAILNRQLALAFCIGIFLGEIICHKKITVYSIFYILLPLATLFCYELFFQSQHQQSNYAGVFFNQSPSMALLPIFFNFCKRWVHYISFTGLVLSPLLLPYLCHYFRQKLFFKHHVQCCIAIVLFVPVVWSMHHFPIGNYLYNCGVGAETFYDTYILHTNTNFNQSFLIFNLLRICSLMGAFSLLLLLVKLGNQIFIYKNNVFFVATCVSIFLYYSFLATSSPIFDRYILIFSILIIPIILKVYNPFHESKNAMLLLIFGLSLFSVLATKDYMNENRKKWEVINDLKAKNTTTDIEINGCLEHCAFTNNDTINWVSKWNNKPENTFVLTKGNLKNYHWFKTYSYQRYIPYKMDTIFVMQKNEN